MRDARVAGHGVNCWQDGCMNGWMDSNRAIYVLAELALF